MGTGLPPACGPIVAQVLGRLSRRRSRGVAWPNTRPCQGRERRFESGRDRQGGSRSRLAPRNLGGASDFAVIRRGGRVVEGGGLENRYGSLAHRELESLPLRHTSKSFPPGRHASNPRLALKGPRK